MSAAAVLDTLAAGTSPGTNISAAVPRSGPPVPRPHQSAALADLEQGLARHDRVQLVMACGTGKTLVGRWYAERSATRLSLVVVPSLGLIGQTLAEWRSARGWDFEPLIVCSDPSTALGAAERADTGGADTPVPFWATHRARVTTNPVVAARFLRRRHRDRPGVVFSTYHSAPVVAEAAAAAGVCFDLLIADEAHRLTGCPRSEFRAVLDDARIPARRRLFMTATPVHTTRTQPADGFDDWSDAVSMADEQVFGPLVHRLAFSTAIGAGLLADYEVVVFDPAAGGAQGPTAAVHVAAAQGLTRVLSFHGRVRKARAFAAAIDQVRLPDGRTVRAVAVAGSDPAVRREAALDRLARTAPSELMVVANARCLAEGVNVPAVDGVLFADPRTSEVDVIQAVGRALRPAPGKTRGVIMVPVVDSTGFDDDTVLSTSVFAPVWRVLRALRTLDDRLATDLDHTARQPSRRGHRTGTGPIPRVRFLLPDSVDLQMLQARLVDATGLGWERFFAALTAHTQDHGCADPHGPGLGQWCDRQRQAHRRGMLSSDRVRRLSELPGWVWDREQARWEQHYAQVLRGAERAGRLHLDDHHTNPAAALPATTTHPRRDPPDRKDGCRMRTRTVELAPA